MAYLNLSTERQLSPAVDYFIFELADSTTCDSLLQDSACRARTWQETVQMAQACEGSRLSLHASSVATAVASAKVGASSIDERIS